MRTKHAGDEAKKALAVVAKDLKQSPHGAVQWCEHALVLAAQHDMLVSTTYRLKHANGKSESQCIREAIKWINDTVLMFARGGRSTSLFANAVTEAQMNGYVSALHDLEFVLEQGEGE